MKQYLLLFAAVSISLAGIAQGKSQGKGHAKAKTAKETRVKVKTADQEINNLPTGSPANTGSKQSKNQPTKVKASFQRDYPTASNVVWSKYRGDWTATFNSGLGRSTAIYHANGERRDTRTTISRAQLPTGTVWDRIFKRDRINPEGNIIQVESPTLRSEIFRIGSRVAGAGLQYYFYNKTGQQVNYNY